MNEWMNDISFIYYEPLWASIVGTMNQERAEESEVYEDAPTYQMDPFTCVISEYFIWCYR